jgi:hypothetical protein
MTRTDHVTAVVIRYVLALPIVVAACSVNRPIALAPGAAGVAEYLSAHHPPDVLVTDSAGHSQWIHRVKLDGDTIRGLRNRQLPPEQVAIPVTQLRSLAIPALSGGRTVGLVCGLLGALAITIAVLATGNHDQPLY